MTGRLSHQEQFFYSFRLDEAVSDDHPVREIAAVLDLSWVHSELAPYYSRLGRPSIDPVLMIRMLIVGYVFAIRSERALCRDVRVNLAYRWFCGLSIEDKIPDHSAFSRARNERFRNSDIFRSVFERVVGACIGAGLVGGEGFAVDASLIVADANKQRSTPGSQWNRELDAQAVSRATKDYLATLDDAAFGAASDVRPKFVSPSDPAAQWTGAMRGPAFFAYSDNYLIDVKFGIIMDVEASRAIRQAEVGAAKSTIERTEQRFDIKPERLAGGTAYGSGANLNWLINEAKIVPHIPVVDEASGMRRKGRVTPLTRERYHELLASYVLPALGDRAIQKLTPTQIDQVYIALEERLSPATVRHVHIALKACLATAVRKGFLVNNPAAKADAPRKVDPEVGRALSAEEVTRLLAGLANTPYYPIVATAVMTGMRLGELLTLRWDDIDFAAHTIRIARALEHTKQFGARIKQPKSWHGKRTIGIDPALTSILKAQHSRHLRLRAGVSERAVVSLGAIRLPAEALVFPATTVRDGRFDFSRIRNARALTKETRTRFRKLGFAGLRFHDLRVTHATALLDAGVPVHTVAQRIGNRPDVLLRAYAKSTSSADERTNGVLATLARSLG